MESTSRIYLFQIVMDDKIHGVYGAFEHSQEGAKEKVENFFRGISPYYQMEARHIDVFPTDTKSADFLNSIGIPIFDRRKMRRQ